MNLNTIVSAPVIGLVCLIMGLVVGRSEVKAVHSIDNSLRQDGSIVITNVLTYSEVLTSLLWRPTLPPGWTMGQVIGDGRPELMEGDIVWTQEIPVSPIKFSFVLIPAVGDLQIRSLRSLVEYQKVLAPNPSSAFALPDPLALSTQILPGSIAVTHSSSLYYAPGSDLAVTNRLEYSGGLDSLLWRALMPEGWVLQSVSGDGSPEILNQEIIWPGEIPPNPINFVYRLRTVAQERGERHLRAQAEIATNGSVNPLVFEVNPDPIVVTSETTEPPVNYSLTGPAFFAPGEIFTLTNSITYQHPLQSALIRFQLPVGWRVASVGSAHQVELQGNELLWTGTIPSSPLNVLFHVEVPNAHYPISSISAEAELLGVGAVNPRLVPQASPFLIRPRPLDEGNLGLPSWSQSGLPVYVPNGLYYVTNQIRYLETPLALLLKFSLPEGWSINSVSAQGVTERSGTELLWTGTIPPSPLNVVYSVNVPSEEEGLRLISGVGEFILSSSPNPILVLPNPDPLQLIPEGTATPPMKFAASMAGDGQVPPNHYGGKGSAVFERVLSKLHYRVHVNNLGNELPVSVHLHAPAGTLEVAPIIATLDGPKLTDRDEVVLAGEVLLSDIQWNVLGRAQVYVDLHTSGFPSGAIRGQISPTSDLPPKIHLVLPHSITAGARSVPIVINASDDNPSLSELTLTINSTGDVALSESDFEVQRIPEGFSLVINAPPQFTGTNSITAVVHDSAGQRDETTFDLRIHAPISDRTLTLRLDDGNGQRNTITSIPLRVGGFDRVNALSFSLQIPPGFISSVSIADIQLVGLSVENFDFSRISEGVLTCNWVSPGGVGITLPDGLSLFQISGNLTGRSGSVVELSVNGSPVPMYAQHETLGSLTIEGGRSRFQIDPVIFQIAEVGGAVGTIVSQGVYVSNFDDVSGVQFSVAWDPLVLKYLEVTDFALTGLGSSSFGNQFVAEGKLTLSWDDDLGGGVALADNVMLFGLRFEVLGNPGASSQVSIVNAPLPVEIFDSQLQPKGFDLIPGRVHSANTSKLQGEVRYYIGNSKVPGVTVGVSSPTDLVTQTQSDGTFNLTVPALQDYALYASKNFDVPPSQGVSTLDITLLRRHILGISTFDSPFKLLAADVNGSRTVSTLDITLMRRVILGITNNFPVGAWVFVPVGTTFPNPNQPFQFESRRSVPHVLTDIPNLDFFGIKLGDVNGSWSPPAP